MRVKTGIATTFILLICFAVLVKLKTTRYPLITEKRIQNLYDLLHRFQQYCKDHKIDYRAIAGTYLGAVRHRGIIPWDDDADVGVMSNDYDLLKSHQHQQILRDQYGLLLWVQTGSFNLIKLFRKEDGIDKGKFGHTLPVMDVFCMEPATVKNEAIIQYKEPVARRLWPNEWFTESEWHNSPAWYSFGPLTVPGAANYETVCDRMWGKNWRTPNVKKMFRFLYPFQISKRLKQWKSQTNQI